MAVTLGIDLGSSTAKLAVMDGERLLLKQRIYTKNPEEALTLALRDAKAALELARGDVESIGLTGVGASFVRAAPYDLPVRHIDEFEAGSAGALAAADVDEALLVTLGTGTAFLHVKRGEKPEHLCGSGIGGGTLQGLCAALTGETNPERLEALFAAGDLRHVNSMVRDVTYDPAPTLDPLMTAANFGALSPDATKADKALGSANLVLEAIGIMALLAWKSLPTRPPVLLAGGVAELTVSEWNFDRFRRFFGLPCRILPEGTYVTAMGAAMCARLAAGD